MIVKTAEEVDSLCPRFYLLDLRKNEEQLKTVTVQKDYSILKDLSQAADERDTAKEANARLKKKLRKAKDQRDHERDQNDLLLSKVQELETKLFRSRVAESKAEIQRDLLREENVRLTKETAYLHKWQVVNSTMAALDDVVWNSASEKDKEKLAVHGVKDMFDVHIVRRQYWKVYPQKKMDVMDFCFRSQRKRFWIGYDKLSNRKQRLNQERTTIAHPPVSFSELQNLLAEEMPPLPQEFIMELSRTCRTGTNEPRFRFDDESV